jgi:NADH:ubiquinone oxidoreductase subunit E
LGSGDISKRCKAKTIAFGEVSQVSGRVRKDKEYGMEKSKINICLGSSCFSRGNKANLEVIQNYLKDNHLEADVHFSGHLCEERCSKGPIISINDRVYEEVTLSRLHKILQEELPC